MADKYGAEELRHFKSTDIHIILPALGWTRHKTEPKTYQKNGRSIKIYLSQDGVTWRFSEFGKGSDAIAGGTVIDLVLGENGNNFPAMRATLRAAINSPVPTDKITNYKFNPSERSTQANSLPKSCTSAKAIEEYLKNTNPVNGIPSYLLKRGVTSIRPSVLTAMRPSKAGGLRFPYGAYEGGEFKILAFEEKWFNSDGQSCRRYMTGGKAGIWIAGLEDHDGVAVVTESPVDAIAYEQLNGGKAMLVAIRSGAISLAAEVINNEIIAGNISNVIIATDNDAAGMTYAAQLMASLGNDLAKVRYISPADGAKDWTELLLSPAHTSDSPSQS